MTAHKVERQPPAGDGHTGADRTVGTRVVEPAVRPTIVAVLPAALPGTTPITHLRIWGRRRQPAAWEPRYGRRTFAPEAVQASGSLPSKRQQAGK